MARECMGYKIKGESGERKGRDLNGGGFATQTDGPSSLS